MHVRFAVAALLLASTVAAPLSAADFPARKPGLWTTSMSTTAMKGMNLTTKMCVDPSVDSQMMQHGMSMQHKMGDACKPQITGSGSTYVMDNACTVGGNPVKTHAVITFSGNTTYHMEATVDSGHADRDMRMSVDARWVGPCPPDMKPGDIDMNGIRVNALHPQDGVATSHGHLTKAQIEAMMKAAQQQQHQQ